MSSKAATVRERLLEAGVTVFSRSGFNGSSVQDITDAAGVPKGSFYNHFESKECLGAATIQHFWNQEADKSRAILSDEAIAPLSRLERYFEQASIAFEAMDYSCGCFIGNMTADLSGQSTVISDQLSSVFNHWTRQIAACIRLAQEQGALSSRVDPESLATFALNAWEGALLRARVTKSNRPLRQFIDTLFRQILA